MIRDSDGQLVRQLIGNSSNGLHQTAWDLRLPAPDPVSIDSNDARPYWMGDAVGPLALPGDYVARLAIERDGELTEVGVSRIFRVKPLDASSEITDDRHALQTFQLKVVDVHRTAQGSLRSLNEMKNRLAHLREAIIRTPATTPEDENSLNIIQQRLADLSVDFSGDNTIGSRNEAAPLGIVARVSSIYWNSMYSQSDPGKNVRKSYEIAKGELAEALSELEAVNDQLLTLEASLERSGAPWTPGRIPKLHH